MKENLTHSPTVFISHSKAQQQSFVENLATNLNLENINAWYDGWEIESENAWAKLSVQLQKGQAVIAVVSREYLDALEAFGAQAVDAFKDSPHIIKIALGEGAWLSGSTPAVSIDNPKSYKKQYEEIKRLIYGGSDRLRLIDSLHSEVFEYLPPELAELPGQGPEADLFKAELLLTLISAQIEKNDQMEAGKVFSRLMNLDNGPETARIKISAANRLINNYLETGRYLLAREIFKTIAALSSTPEIELEKCKSGLTLITSSLSRDDTETAMAVMGLMLTFKDLPQTGHLKNQAVFAVMYHFGQAKNYERVKPLLAIIMHMPQNVDSAPMAMEAAYYTMMNSLESADFDTAVSIYEDSRNIGRPPLTDRVRADMIFELILYTCQKLKEPLKASILFGDFDALTPSPEIHVEKARSAINLIGALGGQGLLDEAQRIYHALLHDLVETPAVLGYKNVAAFNLVYGNIMNKNLTRAMDVYHSMAAAGEGVTEKTRAGFYLAMALAQNNRQDEALDFFQQNSAVPLMGELVNLKMTAAAELLDRSGGKADLIDLLRRLGEASLNEPDLSPASTGAFYGALISAWLAAGRANEAAEYYERIRALPSGPGLARPLMLSSINMFEFLLSRTGVMTDSSEPADITTIQKGLTKLYKYILALEDTDENLVLKSQVAHRLVSYFLAVKQIGDALLVHEARSDFGSSEDAAFSQAKILYNLMAYYAENGQSQSAVDYYQQIENTITHNSERIATLKKRAVLYVVKELLARDETSMAEDFYMVEKASSLEVEQIVPETAAAGVLLMEALIRKHGPLKLNEAILGKAMRLGRDDKINNALGQIMIRIINAYLAAGDPRAAERHFTRLSELDLDQELGVRRAETGCALTEAFLGKKDLARARAIFDSLKQCPTHLQFKVGALLQLAKFLNK